VNLTVIDGSQRIIPQVSLKLKYVVITGIEDNFLEEQSYFGDCICNLQ
jgi:hypothetical protein